MRKQSGNISEEKPDQNTLLMLHKTVLSIPNNLCAMPCRAMSKRRRIHWSQMLICSHRVCVSVLL